MSDKDVTSELPVRPAATADSHNPVSQIYGGAEAPPTSTEAPLEVDDFGLPVRKPRKPVTLQEDAEREQSVQEESELNSPIQAGGSEVRKEEYISRQKSREGRSGDQDDSASRTREDGEPSAQAQYVSSDESIGRQASVSLPGRTSGNDDQLHSEIRHDLVAESAGSHNAAAASEWSHQQLAPQPEHDRDLTPEKEEWQEMPAYAPYDIYDDDGKLIAREAAYLDEEAAAYGHLGGAGKGYTRVQADEDAQSVTSMDDNTAYLFKEHGTNVADEEDEESRDPLAQMQTTKGLLTEGQRIAYVGVVRLAMVVMQKELDALERTKGARKAIDLVVEAQKMWSEKMMVRLYSHMDIDAAEQIMIEQLAEHGVEPGDLTPTLMQNSRVKNPVGGESTSEPSSSSSPHPGSPSEKLENKPMTSHSEEPTNTPALPPYSTGETDEMPEVRTPSQLPNTKSLDIDLRWTVLCDLFLVLIADSVYDSRSRCLLEVVGSFLDIPWLDICRFEKRVADALEMQEAANRENWNEDEHMQNRKKSARNRRLVMMGLATVGGGLVIGLSAGLLAPVIGAGLAAGLSTFGIAGTAGFLGGAGGAAVITTTGVLTGGTIAVRASNRRMGAVKTFEYRPLHNNKRVNLIVTVSGWMNGKVDDVRLPYSTVDPIMGDIYSIYWEPEMLQSMGDTINILATEALTQGLQQILGSTILIALMASLQAPILLAKLSYLIDNPWTVSQARADLAGLILADSLVDRNLGARPVTLVGFSLGARVIFSCLREMANKGAFGLVQNVYLFGTPIAARKDEYLKAKSVVSGRFVNGYTTNDWILAYLFRATSGGIVRVAGLAPVDVPGIENINVTEFVPGHMAYRAAMPRLLRECGWLVESDEFSEIEDPDPENHEKRQRELINEIEEARKELQKKPEKKRFGLFGRKKLTEKKEWEMYDEQIKTGKSAAGADEKNGGILFDIDAIRAEVAELAAQGVEVKQLESTLPPMKLNMAAAQPINPRLTLRGTKSFDGGMTPAPKANMSTKSLTAITNGHAASSPVRNHEYDEYDHPNGSRDEGDISMTFDTSYQNSPAAPSLPRSPAVPSHVASPEPPQRSLNSSPQRPPLQTSRTVPAGSFSMSPEHNAWADEEEDDVGREKEMKMTFE